MTDINTNSASDALSDYRFEPKVEASGNNELGKNQFMELMIAQMENQNPLEPQDNGAFISQLAEFSSLEEMQKLSGSVNSFASQYQSTQALQASAMVGRTVLVPGTESPLGADGTISGIIELPESTGSLSVNIFNGSGELVNNFNMGQQPAGTVPFVWDGTNSDGEYMPFDQYSFKVESSQGGEVKQMNTLLSANVNSVSIGQSGEITLNLSGMGSVPLENVREIN
ncbi:MAG: flagellar basal-body rod modification protein FlgD [Oleiphilaceae bacterium]|jgi:flagellar basal-body rod modification protein FlgD